MAEKVVMPKLGATMEEGTIDNWLVEVGEEVEEGDPIVEIQTDKITMEVEAETEELVASLLGKLGYKLEESTSMTLAEILIHYNLSNENRTFSDDEKKLISFQMKQNND